MILKPLFNAQMIWLIFTKKSNNKIKDCMFLSCHVRVSKWLWVRVQLHKRTLNHLTKLASLAKWLSVRS